MASQDTFLVAGASNLDKKVFQVEKNNTEIFESQYPMTETMEFNFPKNCDLVQESEISTSLNWLSCPNFDKADRLSLNHPTMDYQSFPCQPIACEKEIDFYIDPHSSVDVGTEALVPSEEITLESFEGFNIMQELFPCDEQTSEDVMSTLVSPLPIESVEPVSSNIEDSSDRYSVGLSPAIASKKYFDMRRKNNVACKRSRKIRKLKDLEMEEKLKKLEIENKNLSLLVEELEKQKNDLTKQLMHAISKK